jgi:hypothetical protein
MDVKFTIDRFAQLVGEHYEIDNVRGEECYSIEFSLDGGGFFCIDLNPMEAPIMLFLFHLQGVNTEKEIQVINEVLDSLWDGSNGKVVQVRDREIAYFNMVGKEELCAESLLASLIKMMGGRKNILPYLGSCVS